MKIHGIATNNQIGTSCSFNNSINSLKSFVRSINSKIYLFPHFFKILKTFQFR